MPTFVNMVSKKLMLKGLNGLGLGLTECDFLLLTESYLVMLRFLVKQGAGIGILNAYIANAEPDLVRVLPVLEPLSCPIWQVAHREFTKCRRLRRVYDFLIEARKR